MGVVTHSEPKRVYIFSVYRSNKHQFLNEADHNSMKQFMNMQNIPFIEVVGRYKGEVEQAFLVSAAHLPEEAVLYYARHYYQDEYMVLDNHKHGTYIASMVNCATREQRQLGFMRSMPKEDVMAMNLDYTYRPDMDTYFVAWHTDTTQQGKFEDEKESFLKRLSSKLPLPSGQEPFGTPAFC